MYLYDNYFNNYAYSIEFSDELLAYNKANFEDGKKLLALHGEDACKAYSEYINDDSIAESRKDDILVLNSRNSADTFYYTVDDTDDFIAKNGKEISFSALNVDYEFEIENVKFAIKVNYLNDEDNDPESTFYFNKKTYSDYMLNEF